MRTAKPVQTAPSTQSEKHQETSRPSPPAYPPFQPIPGLSNFRDVGGWPITPSRTSPSPQHVRRNLIFRGGDTTRITPEGEAKLRQLGVKKDYDLRSKQQIEKTGGVKEMEGIERVWTPVFGEEEYTEEKARERYELYAGEGTDGIVRAFIEILYAGAPMLRRVLGDLLDASSTSTSSAIFLHCTTGNNRTGVFVALLLLLLRVPHAHIVREYVLSEAGLAPSRHVNVERLLKKGAFAEYGLEEARRKCERMVGARSESMEALLKEAVSRWGEDGIGYFQGVVGLTEEEIERLRGLMTVEGAGLGDIVGG
ncbi:putative tyrosine-protein phosphatase [Byssothecium circinans]|uniref:Putative tyrosine-protein phosphatase n=1 Tax=Byssothecium circinans TaxID=147558 RepID=A0A6A5TNU9_9PLEO|nr:putative tyrosine-protein phosphatase [Byssothecium circinans]